MSEETFAIRSCLTDVPLNEVGNDKLESKNYAKALYEFIMNADTPVTLGIQGGWGSGKTSMFFLLENLLSQSGHKAVTIKINAWEHSLFQTGEGKGTVVLSILSSLVKAISKIGEESWIDPENKKIFEPDKKGSGLKTKVLGALGQVLPLAGNLAVQSFIPGAAIFNKFLSKPEGKEGDQEKAGESEMGELPILADQIHDLKKQLEDFIEHITYNKGQVRVVVFIDDLDRVPPSTAVEILDVIKNIFDLKNCIFVLAIDYEVIVKGLEDKFGKRNDDNEREFRQYFDKIIQIPFTMPIGAFSKQINAMLEDALKRLNCKFNCDDEKKIIENLSKAVKLATGGLPRSIKRILNTFSLLAYIAQQNKSGLAAAAEEAAKLEARFIIVALHINFPEICKRLMERPDFTLWNIDELNIPWNLKREDNEKTLQAYEKSRFGEYFDESWEKVVFCLCQKPEWLKNNAVNISRLLNLLRDVLTKEVTRSEEEGGHEDAENNRNLSPNAVAILTNVIEGIKVISIDNDFNNTKPENSAMIADQLGKFSAKVWAQISNNLPELKSKQRPDKIEVESDSDGYYWRMPIEGNIDQFYIQWSEDEEALYYSWVADRFGTTISEAEELIDQFLTDDYGSDLYGKGKNGRFEIFSWNENVEFENVANGKLEKTAVEKSLETYKRVEKAVKKLEEAKR